MAPLRCVWSQSRSAPMDVAERVFCCASEVRGVASFGGVISLLPCVWRARRDVGILERHPSFTAGVLLPVRRPFERMNLAPNVRLMTEYGGRDASTQVFGAQ